MVKLCLQFEYKQTKKTIFIDLLFILNLLVILWGRYKDINLNGLTKFLEVIPVFLLLLRCLLITSWSSQFVQVFQEVYCYLYRLKEEIRKTLQTWSISPKERALNEHSEGSRMAIWFSEDASQVVRFCVKKKEKKLKLLTCVKLIVNIACDLLLVSFIPVLAVTLKVNKIDFKNMFLHVHINCYNSSSGDIVMTNSI